MSSKLRLTLMVHIEDANHWDGTSGAPVAGSIAKRVAELATVVGQHGGKVSVQFGRWFVDATDTWTSNAAYRYTAPSSLKMVLDNGGNFWCHTHDGSYTNLQTVHTCVASAVAGEIGTTIDYVLLSHPDPVALTRNPGHSRPGSCHSTGKGHGHEQDAPALHGGGEVEGDGAVVGDWVPGSEQGDGHPVGHAVVLGVQGAPGGRGGRGTGGPGVVTGREGSQASAAA